MSRAARFTQADVERVLRAAKNVGVKVELDLNTGAVRTLTEAESRPQLTELQQWKARRDAKRAP